MYAINRKTNAVYNRGTDMKEDPLESGSSFVIVFHRDNDIAHFTPLIDILVACGG